ncbi:hypothetical protein [Lysinibacter sp. HNR]|uniref:DUF6993 domain-containing protein n=1 Tax=Lysinibacter sp. HNR TaxID=3031408 RepID=UPI002434929D|nr:hypothetical protein [Lysinibacter sp. HNR]WGD36441.1 hypothetical protein FrondiHNR_08105 [Lysinibacter sp. HNR]
MKRNLRSGAALVGIALMLSGCAAFNALTGQSPEVRSTNIPTMNPDSPGPEFVPGGSAEENLDFFNFVNLQTAQGGAAINGQNVVNALVAGGFDKQAMQVSLDQTTQGLTADSIFVSVRIGSECLIGQLTTEDRTVVGAVEPVVGPDESVCLIGSTRPIDW